MIRYMCYGHIAIFEVEPKRFTHTNIHTHIPADRHCIARIQPHIVALHMYVLAVTTIPGF